MLDIFKKLCGAINVHTADNRLVLRPFRLSVTNGTDMGYNERLAVFSVAYASYNLGDNIPCLADSDNIAYSYILAVDIVLIMKHRS